MKVPDEVRKTVGFVAYKSKLSGDVVPVGSFFFLGHDPNDGTSTSRKMYAVTARHIVDALKAKGRADLTLRLNPKEAGAPLINVMTRLDQWFVHPSNTTIDVAILEMGIPKEADHLVIPFSMCATDQTYIEHEVALGDEVFISGLFRHHYGKSRNIPIVRTGNLAALEEERVQTVSFGAIDALLIEARSLGGLSGSPVFLNLGIVRQIGGKIKNATGTGPIMFLLGLVHGHFDTPGDQVNEADKSSTINEKINAGIAIVVPISKVREVIVAYESKSGA